MAPDACDKTLRVYKHFYLTSVSFKSLAPRECIQHSSYLRWVLLTLSFTGHGVASDPLTSPAVWTSVLGEEWSMEEATTFREPLKSNARSAYVPYPYVLCTILGCSFYVCLYSSSISDKSAAVPTVKEKAQQGLHKTGAELSMCSCSYRQQSTLRKQVQEGKQSSLYLRVWDTVLGSLGSFQGWVSPPCSLLGDCSEVVQTKLAKCCWADSTQLI